MFIVTADQRGSRTGRDLVPDALTAVVARGRQGLALEPERTAGDEVQAAVTDASALLAIVLDLTRTGRWSVGVGVGEVEQPMPPSVRAGRGTAFVNAREAVDRAKKAPTRLAITGTEEATDAESLVRLMVELRDRRTAEGWEVYDLLAEGLTQREAAARLEISESAVSMRVKSAGLRAEEAALPALVRVLTRADTGSVRD